MYNFLCFKIDFFIYLFNKYSYKTSSMSVNKKVTFAKETKKHDGVAFHRNSTVLYSIICGATNQKFLNCKIRKVNNKEDILLISNYDDEALKYSRERMNILIKKLTDLKNKIDLNDKDQLKDNLISKDFDSYWDSDFFVKKAESRKITRGRISLVRRGCRDFNIAFSICNIKFLEHVNNLIGKAIDDVETKQFLDEWFVVSKE